MAKRKTLEEGGRMDMRYVHVTLHNLENDSLDYWLNKGMSFVSNTTACLVGLEENHGEGKGLHAHIVIQFSTRQKLSRKQFVDHFGTDSLHIAVKPNKQALMMVLGYVVKAGNHKQEGDFTYKGSPIESDPEVYKFNYQVRTIDDGLAYFHKVIKEHIKDENVIEKYLERDDAIGRWLQKNSSHAKTLIKLAHTWNLNYKNSHKKGFKFRSWVDSPVDLAKAYRQYLKAFPAIFEKEKPQNSNLVLEFDYDRHEDHDLRVLRLIKDQLCEAMEYGSHRPHKSLNLFIWSRSPSFGKTRLMKFLDAHLMAYRLPDDQWYVDYRNDIYTVLVSDEADNFIKSKDYSHLKQIFEGETVEFNMKGKTKGFKKDNPLIVLADNVSFDELMTKRHKSLYTKQVMDTRVLDLELKSRATLHFLLDRCLLVKDMSDALPLLSE